MASTIILHFHLQPFTWSKRLGARVLTNWMEHGRGCGVRHTKVLCWTRAWHWGCPAWLSLFFLHPQSFSLLTEHPSSTGASAVRTAQAPQRLRVPSTECSHEWTPGHAGGNMFSSSLAAHPWCRETSPCVRARGTQSPPYTFFNSLFPCKSLLITTAYLYLPGSSFLFGETRRPHQGNRREKHFLHNDEETALFCLKIHRRASPSWMLTCYR